MCAIIVAYCHGVVLLCDGTIKLMGADSQLRGVTLRGSRLLTGALGCWCTFWAASLMVLFRMGGVRGGLAQNFPVEHEPSIDAHTIYLLVLYALGALGTGRLLGAEGWQEQTSLAQNSRWLRAFLGGVQTNSLTTIASIPPASSDWAALSVVGNASSSVQPIT